ncbi:hypothetical protein [Liberiplasma polymorphum]|uniref:hypothetical protein n=1 Tax=Liberiplasma polymorphum TaxID=3374570 RepID=UPI00377675C8
MTEESVLSRVWALLIGYAFVFIMFIGKNTGVFTSIIRHEADPFLMMLFYLVGIFTIGFILLVWHTEERPKLNRMIGLFLSLFFGAFALMPVYEDHGQDILRKSPIAKIFVILSMVISIGLVIYGFGFGSFKVFSDSWLKDGFLHIMTVNFLILYVFSIVIAKNYTQKWQVTFVPILGFYYFIYREFNR